VFGQGILVKAERDISYTNFDHEGVELGKCLF
jgi:hypothetical protein